MQESDIAQQKKSLRLRSVDADTGQQRELNVDLGTTFIGRSGKNQIILDGDLISRRHAKLILNKDGLTLFDLDSDNGVFLNGTKISAAQVKIGDRLYFANYCFQLEEYIVSEKNLNDEKTNPKFEYDDLQSHFLLSETDEPSYEDSSDENRFLKALLQASELIDIPSVEHRYKEIVRLCRQLCHASYAAITLEQDNKSLDLKALDSDFQEYYSVPPISWGAIRRSIKEAAILFTPDAETQPLESQVLSASLQRGAILCIPMIYKKHAYGVLYLNKINSSSKFSSRELECLSAILHLLTRSTHTPSINHSQHTSNPSSDATATLLSQLEQTQNKNALLEKEKKRLQLELQKILLEDENRKSFALDSQKELKQLRLENMSLAAKNQQLKKYTAQAHHNSSDNNLQDILTLRQKKHIAEHSNTHISEIPFRKQEVLAVFTQLYHLDLLSEKAEMSDIKKYLCSFFSLTQKLSEKFNGEYVQTIGNGLLLTFNRDKNGVQNAIQFSKMLHHKFVTSKRGYVQSGIHLGTLALGYVGNDQLRSEVLIGTPWLIAREISLRAPKGEIMVSHQVRKAAGSSQVQQFISHGPHYIPSLSSPTSLYQLK